MYKELFEDFKNLRNSAHESRLSFLEENIIEDFINFVETSNPVLHYQAKRKVIEKEVTRLQKRCLTEDGKAGIVTDYILRLLNENAAQLERAADKAVCSCKFPELANVIGDPVCKICNHPLYR